MSDIRIRQSGMETCRQQSFAARESAGIRWPLHIGPPRASGAVTVDKITDTVHNILESTGQEGAMCHRIDAGPFFPGAGKKAGKEKIRTIFSNVVLAAVNHRRPIFPGAGKKAGKIFFITPNDLSARFRVGRCKVTNSMIIRATADIAST